MVFSKAMLAAHINVPLSLLSSRAFAPDQSRFYQLLKVKKRDGTERDVWAPYWPMKNIQSKLGVLLNEMYVPSARAHAYISGRSIKTNARFHVRKRNVLNVDISSFFETITFPRIRGRLLAPPYNLTNDVATTVAKLCTLNGHLPVGSPASPVIANMICSKLDYDLSLFAKSNGCTYSRYADDITFSTNRHRFPSGMAKLGAGQSSGPAEVGDQLEKIFTDHGFNINQKKTRVLSKYDSQEICGVICNEKMNVRKKFLRQIRAMLHAWRKFGKILAEAEWKKKYNWRGAYSFETSLRGKIEFLIFIRGKQDDVAKNYIDQYNKLNDRLFSDIIYEFDEHWEAKINKAVCVVEGHDDDNVEYSQGSGFVIEKGLIVTNCHVIEKEGQEFPRIEIRFHEWEKITFEAEIIEKDADKDIAVLRIKDDSWREIIASSALELDFRKVEKGESIWLCGFPSYHLGEDCAVDSGIVVGNQTGNGERFRISSTIVEGNSGGPVFDESGKVIGVAVTGVGMQNVTSKVHNGCILLTAVKSAIISALAK